MKSTDICKRFVDHYENIGYQLLPSAPMLDSTIPKSFVMSAGLIQIEASVAKSKLSKGNKYVLVQNCFRHFDLEKVGKDDVHLSLFSMPGAFVFEPNKKTAAISNIWTLITNVLGIDKDKIWVSYFKGGEIQSIYMQEDIETRNAWLSNGISNNQIVGLNTEHNYWLQGDGFQKKLEIKMGGPHTELFFDRGKDIACSKVCKPGCKCGRFVEFANCIFINAALDTTHNSIQKLDNPFIETVIGAERISMISAGAKSVFEIDEFKEIRNEIRKFTKLQDNSIIQKNTNEKIIADHVRALIILVANGAPEPKNKYGRQLIIRNLIRRILTSQVILGIENFDYISKTITTVLAKDSTYNETAVYNTIIEYLNKELQRFQKTHKKGYFQLKKFIKENGGKTLTGAQIMYLEKRLGFPSVLSSFYLKRNDFSISEQDYCSLEASRY